MTITEFLEARIREDEYAAGLTYETCFVGRVEGNGSRYDLALRMNPARVLAECAAKRQILERAMSLGDDGYYTAEYMPSREHETTPGEVGGRRIYPGHPSFTQTVIYSGVLRDLAAVYASHPDYRQEWAV